MKRSQLKTLKLTQQKVCDHIRNIKTFVVSFKRKTERSIINKVKNNKTLNKVKDNKTFWKTIKPFLSNKGTNINKITLADNDKVISDDKQRCKLLVIFSKRL